MKKLFTLLGLLVLVFANAVTLNAQTPDATPITDEEVPTGYYFIASTEATAYNITSPYIAANGGTMKLVARTAVTTDYSTSQVGLWYIEKKGTTSSNSKAYYYIKSLEGNGLYWAANANCPLGTSAGYYNIIQADDQSGYYFSGNGGGITNTGYVNATSATVFNRSNSGSYNKWKLIPAGFTPQDITITYNATSTTGSRSFCVTKKTKVGDVVSTDLGLDFYSSYNPTSITVEQGTSAHTVTCTSSFPFTEGKYYKMKMRWANTCDGNKTDQTDGVYTYRSVVWTNGQVKGQINTRETVTQTNNALWTIKFVDGTANQVYLCSAVGDQKVTIDNATTNNLKAYMGPVGTPFYVKKGNTGSNYTNGFRLQALSNENANLNDINGLLGYWTDGGSKTDEGSTFTIEEAACPEQTINTLVATNTVNNEQITISGLNIQEHLTSNAGDKLVCNSFFTTSEGSYDADTKTFTVKYTPTSSAPYQLSGLGESEAKHWMVIRTRNDANEIQNCYLKMSGDNIQSRNNAIDRTSLNSIKTFTETDANYWAIVPAGNFSQFYLVNKSDETKKAYLAKENNGTTVTMSSENATGFYLNAQPEFSGITGGFTIQPNNSNNHAVGDHCNGTLGYWNNRGESELNDAGSIFYTVDLLSDCKSIVSNTSAYVGGFSTQCINDLKATTTCVNFFTKYDEVKAVTSNFSAPDANKLYRISFKRGNVTPVLTSSTANASGEVSTEEAQRLVTFVNSSTNTPSALVRFVSVDGADGQYYIQDVNSGLYYGYFGTGNYDQDKKLYAEKDKSNAGKYSVTNSINGTVGDVGLKDNTVSDDNRKQYLWSCGDTESGILNTYNYVKFHSAYSGNVTTGSESTIEPGIILNIKEVTTYPVTISYAQFASLCLPFSVTLPSNGLTANKVTAVSGDDKALTLESVGNTMAKDEPVILSGNAGTYTLTINSTDGTKSEGNILTGTSVKRTGITDTYYALGYKALDETDAENKTAGFYKVNTQTMPANKAYLLKSNIPAQAQEAMMFSFNFDLTGINHLINGNAADAESNAYYDLNGRRVLYPTRGIYVKGNGQKVFIK